MGVNIKITEINVCKELKKLLIRYHISEFPYRYVLEDLTTQKNDDHQAKLQSVS